MHLLSHKKLSFEQFMQWPVKIKLACVALMTSFTLFFGYAFYLKNEIVYLDQVKSNIVKLSEKLQIQQQELQTLITKTTNSTQSSLLSKKITSDVNSIQLITALTQLAQLQGIKIQNLQLQVLQNKPNYVIQPIHCVVMGTYQQLRQFIMAFMHLPFLLIISSGNITPINSSQNLMFDFVLQHYQLPMVTV